MKKKTKYSLWENAKYMLKLMQETDKASLPIVLAYIVPAVMTPLMSTVLLKMLLNVLETGDELEKIFISVGIFVVLSALFTALKDLFDMKAYIKGYILRLKCHKVILNASMNVYYESIESREKRALLEKAQRFVATPQSAEAIQRNLRKMLVDLTGIFSAFAIFLYVDLRLVGLLFIVGVCTFLLFSRIADVDKSYEDELTPLIWKNFYLTQEKPTEIKAAKDIRIFNITSWFSPLLDIIMGDRKEIVRRFFKRSAGLRSLEMLLILVREGVTVYFLISSVVNGKISVSDFAFYFGILNAFSVWIKDMALDFQSAKTLCLQCDDYRIFVEQTTPDMENKPEVPLDASAPCDIEFRNVSFSYDKKEPTLDNISIKVKSGEKIAIVGENGAGKTTCMKLLTGLYSPDSGEILINGINTADIPEKQQFSLFSALFQDAFYLAAGIDENVSLSAQPDENRVDEALKKAGLYDKVMTLENGVHTPLDKELSKGGVDLSGGEMQKLFFARALYKDAPIIILDEPTAALDPIAENELYMKFNDLTKNKTSFYISHRLSSTRFCDRILFLKDGKIVEEGTHEELMALRGGYFRMYEMQSYYYKEEGGRVNEF